MHQQPMLHHKITEVPDRFYQRPQKLTPSTDSDARSVHTLAPPTDAHSVHTRSPRIESGSVDAHSPRSHAGSVHSSGSVHSADSVLNHGVRHRAEDSDRASHAPLHSARHSTPIEHASVFAKLSLQERLHYNALPDSEKPQYLRSMHDKHAEEQAELTRLQGNMAKKCNVCLHPSSLLQPYQATFCEPFREKCESCAQLCAKQIDQHTDVYRPMHDCPVCKHFDHSHLKHHLVNPLHQHASTHTAETGAEAETSSHAGGTHHPIHPLHHESTAVAGAEHESSQHSEDTHHLHVPVHRHEASHSIGAQGEAPSSHAHIDGKHHLLDAVKGHHRDTTPEAAASVAEHKTSSSHHPLGHHHASTSAESAHEHAHAAGAEAELSSHTEGRHHLINPLHRKADSSSVHSESTHHSLNSLHHHQPPSVADEAGTRSEHGSASRHLIHHHAADHVPDADESHSPLPSMDDIDRKNRQHSHPKAHSMHSMHSMHSTHSKAPSSTHSRTHKRKRKAGSFSGK